MDNLVENLKISEVAEIVKEKLEIAKSKMNQEFASNVEPKNGVYGDSEKFEQEKVECPYSDEILDYLINYWNEVSAGLDSLNLNAVDSLMSTVPDPLLIWTPTLGGLYGSYV